MIDTVIYHGLVVTVDEAFTCIPNGAMAVTDGCITDVWAPGPGAPLPEAREILDARGGMVLPGLVNGHTHLPMSLFRGLADDLPLETWLGAHIFPAEAKYIFPKSVHLGTRLSCAEMLLSGTTTCCDGYFHAGSIAEAVAEAGLRAVLGQGVIDFPAPGVADPSQNVRHARSFVEGLLGKNPRITPAIFCHSPYTCSAETLRGAKQAARDLGVLFQIHVAETRDEQDQCRKNHGCGPVGYLRKLGLLDPDTLLVHAVWVDPDEIGMISDSGARIVHCPESNMKLASGISPVPDFLAAGIPVGLGTDGCASNNDLDMFGEMATCAKLHKVARLDPTVMDSQTVLRMATIAGARALGLDRWIGSLEKGKRADIIVLDADAPHLTPLYHPASHLVYAARGGDVRHVMIDGQWRVRDRRLTDLDLTAVMTDVSDFVKTIEF